MVTSLPYHTTLIPWVRAIRMEVWNSLHFQVDSTTKIIKNPFVLIRSLQMERWEMSKINYVPDITLEEWGFYGFINLMPQPKSPCCNVLITAEAAICLSSRKVYSEQSFGSFTQAHHLQGFTAFLHPAIPVFSSFVICAVCILIYSSIQTTYGKTLVFFQDWNLN